MSPRARVVLVIGLGGLALLGVWLALPGSPRELDRPRTDAPARPLDAPPGSSARTATHEPARPLDPGAPRIAGRVIDADDGPLAEGSLLLGCPDGTSLGRAAIGEDGEFEAPACPGSPTCARLIHPGSVQPRAWQLDADESVELEVDPAPRVAGIVLAEGRPVAAARVIARRGDRRWTAGTDMDGSFTVAMAEPATDENVCEFEPRVSDQPVALVVLAPGHRPWTASVPATGDEALSVALAEPAAALTGSLGDPRGRSFTRARVLATSRNRPDEAHVTRPDAEGRFEFAELGDGVYELRVVRDGVELVRSEAEAGADVVMVGTLPARGPTLELRLLDDRGEPMAGVRVDGGPFQAAHTDEAGSVVATDVFVGAYDLRLRAPGPDCGVSRERIEVPEGEQDRTIRVDLSLVCEADESSSSAAPPGL